MNNVAHDRFKSAPWYTLATKTVVTVGGAGGTGSWTTMLLARAGFRPVVFDFDTVEIHNMAGQLYTRDAIGKSKVKALQELIESTCDTKIMACNQSLDTETRISRFCIAAFDNMAARRTMFESWKKNCCLEGHPLKDALFIDTRLEVQHMWIYCLSPLKPDNIKEYEEKYLKDDSEIPEAMCTFKQTSHAAAMLASNVVGFLTNHITNVATDEDMSVVPFRWEYYIPRAMTTINN